VSYLLVTTFSQQRTVDINGQQQSAELTLMLTSFCDQ